LIYISEEKNLKERFGNLGLYLINKAQEEIKEFNRQNLFQKAEIRKIYLERSNENFLRLKNHFIEAYNQYLNNSLSSTLLELKEKELDLKNNLIRELENSIYELMKEKIQNKYEDYVKYLLDYFKDKIDFIDKPTKIEILFNYKDFAYFSKNSKKIDNLFKNSFVIKEAPGEFIGGFKVILSDGNISYDYSIDNLITKNSDFIQKKLFDILTESGIKEIERDFAEFIERQKLGLEGHLKKYDRI
jgi:vacuolar-type H+-ATPase subunit E/Vma4